MVLGKLGVERQRRKVGPLVHANHRQSLKVDHGTRCKCENCKVIGKKQRSESLWRLLRQHFLGYDTMSTSDETINR